MTFQEKILYCRRKAGLSQEALANKMGVSRQAVSKWETGEASPELSKLSSMAEIFNVTTDWLLSDEEPYESGKDSFNSFNGTGNTQNIYNGSTQNFETVYPADSEREKFYKNVNTASRGIFRFAKRNAWYVGIYIAIMGLVFIGMGFGIRAVSNSFIESSQKTMNEFVNLSNDSLSDFYADSNGTHIYTRDDLDDPELEKAMDFMHISDKEVFGSDAGTSDTHPGSLTNTEDSMLSNVFDFGSNAFNTVTSIIILMGLLITAAGVILAVVLRIRLRNAADPLG